MDGAWHEEAFLTYLPLPERLSAASALVSFFLAGGGNNVYIAELFEFFVFNRMGKVVVV